MRKYIHVVLGLSGAGKDTVAKLIAEQVPVFNAKFSAPAKRVFEKWLSLPDGAMDDREFRKRNVVNPITGYVDTSCTYLDLMVRAYHSWKDIHPYLTVWNVAKQIEEMLVHYDHVVCTDVRNVEELNSLVEMSKYSEWNVWLRFLYVSREKAEELSSDKQLNLILSTIKNGLHYVGILNNDGTIDELRERVIDYMND